MSLSEIALCVMPFFAVWCFYAGYKVGKGEKVPVAEVKTPRERKEARQKTKQQKAYLERLNTIQKNLENYNGTSEGQIEL